MSELSRRSFFLGAAAAVAITPVAVQVLPTLLEPALEIGVVPSVSDFYAELTAITRKAFVPRLYVEIYQYSPLFLQLLANEGCDV